MAIMSLDPTGKGQASLDHALEDRAERLRHDLRRPPVSSPSPDGIHDLPGSDSTTGHYSHGIIAPRPDQRKRSLQLRKDNGV
nr:hypothetical protein [Streptomyces sp. AC495_CC817]